MVPIEDFIIIPISINYNILLWKLRIIPGKIFCWRFVFVGKQEKNNFKFGVELQDNKQNILLLFQKCMAWPITSSFVETWTKPWQHIYIKKMKKVHLRLSLIILDVGWLEKFKYRLEVLSNLCYADKLDLCLLAF